MYQPAPVLLGQEGGRRPFGQSLWDKDWHARRLSAGHLYATGKDDRTKFYIIAWRSLAETHSPTTTVATMMSTMTLTLDQARFAYDPRRRRFDLRCWKAPWRPRP